MAKLVLDVLVHESELGLDTSSESSGSSGSDQTDLSTGRSDSGDGSGLTNVLMVTTTVRMLNGVHSNTANHSFLSLRLTHVMDLSSLTDGLFVTSTSGDDSDHGSGVTLDGSLDTGRHLDSGLEPIFGVTDDEGVGSGSSGELTVVTGVLLNVADDGSFGDTVDGKHVSDGELGLDSAVDVLTGVHTLSSEEELGVHAVFMGVSELDLGQRSSSTGVMDDLSDNTLDVSTS